MVTRLFEYFICKKSFFKESQKDEGTNELRKFFNSWDVFCREKRLKVAHSVFFSALAPQELKLPSANQEDLWVSQLRENEEAHSSGNFEALVEHSLTSENLMTFPTTNTIATLVEQAKKIAQNFNS